MLDDSILNRLVGKVIIKIKEDDKEIRIYFENKSALIIKTPNRNILYKPARLEAEDDPAPKPEPKKRGRKPMKVRKVKQKKRRGRPPKEDKTNVIKEL